MPMNVELVSPEKILYSGEANGVYARTVGGGDIAFLPGHAPFIGALDLHHVTIQPVEGDDIVVAVHGGFVEVSDNKVTILSDVAELPHQIDHPRAVAAKEAAEEGLRMNAEDATVRAALARAETRIAVHQGLKADGTISH